MATINNGKIIKSIIDKAKIQTATDKVPNQLAEKVVPVMEVNPQHDFDLKIASGTVSDATDGTIHTCHATKKTYLVSATVSVAKDVVSDSVYTWVRIRPFGQATDQVAINMRYEPITVGSNLIASLNPVQPILLEKSSVIGITNSTATASIDTGFSVIYFEVED